MLYEVQTTTAAAALAACWALESFIPIISADRIGAERFRHLLLGALNAVPAVVIAGVLAIADAGSQLFGFGLLNLVPLSPWVAVIVGFLILDLSQYACHVFMHKIPLMWRIHAVHHHAEHMESTTAFRFHTLEIVAHGMVLLPLVLLLGIRVHDIAIYNAILIPMSLFHHANVKLPIGVERVLGLVIVTPGLHRMHHSRWQPQTDSNYSAVLSIWDRVFGTLTMTDRPETISVGLDGFGPEHTRTIKGMLLTPFSSARAGMGTPPGSDDSPDAAEDLGKAGIPTKTPRPTPKVRQQKACNDPVSVRV